MQQLTVMFGQPEFYPILIIAGLIGMAVLITSYRFLRAKHFLAFFLMWHVLLVSTGALISFFRANRQRYSVGADDGVMSASRPLTDYMAGPDVQLFAVVLGVFAIVFILSAFRKSLSVNLGARLSMEGFAAILIVTLALVLIGFRGAAADADVSTVLASYQIPLLVCGGWFIAMAVYWLLGAFRKLKTSRILTVLQFTVFLVGAVLLVAPLVISHLSQFLPADMDYQGQFEVWNRLSGYGAYCVIASYVLLGVIFIVALIRKTRQTDQN